MTICFGQAASNGTYRFSALVALSHLKELIATGELGLGPEEPKSATKPTRNVPLAGVDIFECGFSLLSS